MIADLEEVVSGNNEHGTSPFTGTYIFAGYGGKQGFIALDHTDLLDRSCSGPGYRKWNENHSPLLMVEACERLLW